MTDLSNNNDHAANTRAADLSVTTPAEDARTVLLNRVNWGAIFTGAVIALKLSRSQRGGAEGSGGTYAALAQTRATAWR